MHRKATHRAAICAATAIIATFGTAACAGVGASSGAPSPSAPSANAAPAPAMASSLAITGVNTLSAKGENGRLTATVTYTDGTVQNCSTHAQWASSNEQVATVDASGVVTAIADGRTMVTAAFESVSGAKTIVVDLP